MKLWKLSFVLLTLFFAAACEDEEMPMVCMLSDWVGTYSGTQTCDGNDPQNVTVNVTASGADALFFSYSTANGSTTAFTMPFTFDGCTVSFSLTESGVTSTVDAELMGDNLSFDDNAFGDCMITATRN